MSTDPLAPAAVDALPSVPAPIVPRPRHPLGLPPGSVRAVIILMVMGTIWALLLMPEEKNIEVPLYLYYLLFLTLGSYFSGRAQAPVGSPSPLYLPRGSIRAIIVLGFAGVMGYAIFRDPEGFWKRPLLDPEDRAATMLLPTVIIGAYLVGVIVAGFAHKLLNGPLGMPAWYQDVLAWVSLLAVLGLGIEVILQLIVFPSMPEPRPQVPQMQLLLSGIVALYFGARA